MVASDEPLTEFAQLLVDLDEALGEVRSVADWSTKREADAQLLRVLKNLNERILLLEKCQEGR